jgi:hypothetical protein
MKPCALDPDYVIEVKAEDSPTFHNLVKHWEGRSETVVDLEEHYYEEIISLTMTRRHVVSLLPAKPEPVRLPQIYKPPVDQSWYSPEGPKLRPPLPPDGLYRKDESRLLEPARQYVLADIDATMTLFEKMHHEENIRRPKFFRVRLFFRLVGLAFKEARAS